MAVMSRNIVEFNGHRKYFTDDRDLTLNFERKV